jgi:ectoine hydroxylase
VPVTRSSACTPPGLRRARWGRTGRCTCSARSRTVRGGPAFDRRIWHARSRNYSGHTRKAVFFGYTYRWTAVRDDTALVRGSDWFARLTPVQRQLPGGAEDVGGDHAWGHYPATTPLYGWLKERGSLDPANPPLKP